MATSRQSDSIDDELTPAQIRELRRRMADLDDVTRYLLVSQMGPRFALYYNVSDDVYAMNDPRGATLFKRLKAALAVKALLGGSIRILRCKSRRVNNNVLSMPIPFVLHDRSDTRCWLDSGSRFCATLSQSIGRMPRLFACLADLRLASKQPSRGD